MAMQDQHHVAQQLKQCFERIKQSKNDPQQLDQAIQQAEQQLNQLMQQGGQQGTQQQGGQTQRG